jgi:hypothetical protein
MAIAVRQEKSNNAGGQASTLVTFTSTTLAGSVVIVGANCDAGGTSIAFSNDKGDSYTDSGIGFYSGNAGVARIGAFLTPTTASVAYTGTFGGPPSSFTEVIAWEITGLTSPAIDQTAHNTGTGTATSSGATGTLAAVSEIGAAFTFCGASMTSGTEGAGWVEDEITPAAATMVQHIITSSTAAITAIGTQSGSSNWQALLVTVRSAIAAKGGTLPLMGVGRRKFYSFPRDRVYVPPRKRLILFQRAV